jgi:putative transposase
MLTVLDEYTREALCVAVGTKMGASEVLDILYPLLVSRGKPEYLRSDNGPEFTANPFREWLRRVGIQPIQIYPGSPWENGYNERFNGTLRREVLNAEWFMSTRQAQTVINQWLRQYNHIRPHHALSMRPPVPETSLVKSQFTGTDTGGSTQAGWVKGNFSVKSTIGFWTARQAYGSVSINPSSIALICKARYLE